MDRSARTMYRRRLSNSRRIRSSSSEGPSIAASAAAWLTAAALVVDCPCSVPIASITAGGASANPIRHPVIAYALETPSAMMVRLRTSGPKVAGWTNVASP